MKLEKLKVKDVMTIVLLSLVNIVIFGMGSLFYLSPFTVLLMPVFYSIFQGVVYYVMCAKIKKPGVIIIYSLIQGLIGFNLVYILMFLLAGIIGELVVYKMHYGNYKAIGISYVTMQLLASFGSTIYPYAIALDKTLEQHGENGSYLENVRQAGEMIQSWGVIILIILILLSAIVGAYFGYLITKKHFALVEKINSFSKEEKVKEDVEEEKAIDELFKKQDEQDLTKDDKNIKELENEDEKDEK